MVDQKHSYLTLKNGVYYYTRRVPIKLIANFGKARFVKCLHTSSEPKAQRLGQEISSRLENIWDRMRLDLDDYGVQTPIKSKPEIRRNRNAVQSFRISDARVLYLRLKGVNRTPTFATASVRNSGYLIEMLGDLQLTELTTNHGGEFRDYLFSKGLSSASVKRVFSSVRAIINLGAAEKGLEIINPFSAVFVPDDGKIKKRLSFSTKEIFEIQRACFDADDEMRWLIALLSDTGMRLSEACGLAKTDVFLDGKVPYVELKPHRWRRLKTHASERQIPLSGAALWAATRSISESKEDFIFPKYCDKSGVKSNSASGSLNKWLKKYGRDGTVIHSFRHSFRDRLREVGCNIEIIDQLGGWSKKSIGQTYGNGYTVEQTSKWVHAIVTGLSKN